MKTNLIRIGIAWIAVFGILYLAVSFARWELNPEDWPVEARATMSFIGVVISGFVTGIVSAPK